MAAQQNNETRIMLFYVSYMLTFLISLLLFNQIAVQLSLWGLNGLHSSPNLLKKISNVEVLEIKPETFWLVIDFD